MLPWFTVLPPAGFGVIATVGRNTGKTRRRCIRAIRRGTASNVVSIPGAAAGWLKNIRANPDVRLRIRDGSVAGRARELRNPGEVREAMKAYCEAVNRADYGVHAAPAGATDPVEDQGATCTWFNVGAPLVVEIASPANAVEAAAPRNRAS